MYNAYSIEVAVRNLCQHADSQRGKFYDADVFRSGNPNELKEFLEKLSQVLKDRISPDLSEEQKAWLNSAINSIHNAKSRITQQEQEDYHWLIVGQLISIINLLLQK
jgi:SNF2 family DNA or RNA helicase